MYSVQAVLEAGGKEVDKADTSVLTETCTTEKIMHQQVDT